MARVFPGFGCSQGSDVSHGAEGRRNVPRSALRVVSSQALFVDGILSGCSFGCTCPSHHDCAGYGAVVSEVVWRLCTFHVSSRETQQVVPNRTKRAVGYARNRIGQALERSRYQEIRPRGRTLIRGLGGCSLFDRVEGGGGDYELTHSQILRDLEAQGPRTWLV